MDPLLNKKAIARSKVHRSFATRKRNQRRPKQAGVQTGAGGPADLQKQPQAAPPYKTPNAGEEEADSGSDDEDPEDTFRSRSITDNSKKYEEEVVDPYTDEARAAAELDAHYQQIAISSTTKVKAQPSATPAPLATHDIHSLEESGLRIINAPDSIERSNSKAAKIKQGSQLCEALLQQQQQHTDSQTVAELGNLLAMDISHMSIQSHAQPSTSKKKTDDVLDELLAL